MANDTVYDRMKKTGYITGSRHKMFPPAAAADAGADDMGDDEAAEPTPPTPGEEAAEGEGQPPNLRDADGPESCGDCAYFTMSGPYSPSEEAGGPPAAPAGPPPGGGGGSGACALYNGFSVTPNEVCDSFAPAQGEAGPPMPGGGMPGTPEESPY